MIWWARRTRICCGGRREGKRLKAYRRIRAALARGKTVWVARSKRDGLMLKPGDHFRLEDI